MKPVSLDKLQNDIIRPGIEEKLVPLALFRGRQSIGRLHQLWNLTITMMHSEADCIGHGVLLSGSLEFSHLCGPHKPVNHMGLQGFFSRLRLCPEVTDNVPHLREYAEYIYPDPLQLTPVSLYSQRRSNFAPWRIAAPYKQRREPRKPKVKAPETALLFYPYLIHEPGKEHELLMFVHNAVPKNLPDQVRADICQDLLVGLLSGEITRDQVTESVKENTRRVFQMFPTKYGPLSLDAPAPWSDDGRTLAETIGEDDIAW